MCDIFYQRILIPAISKDSTEGESAATIDGTAKGIARIYLAEENSVCESYKSALELV